VPGGRIRDAWRLRAQALAVLDSAVLVDLVDGVSWSEVAEALGLTTEATQQRYQDVAFRWRAVEPPSGLDLSVFTVRGETAHPDDDPRGTAEAVDLWYSRRAEPWETAEPTGLLDL
jgi:hypothetical protein